MRTTSKPKARKHSRPSAPSPEASRRFIAYYRVSTRAQGRSGLGIEAQQETVQRFLEAEGGGLPPLASYTETESGRRKDRPQLAKALAACRAHRATLVVAKVDRLARSQAFLESILTSGARVRFCDLPEIKGATGRFMLRQMASVAELEGEFIGERTKAALAARVARAGQWDRKAKHHLVPGAGQEAAVASLKEQADARASDLADFIGQLRKDGAGTLREIAEGLNRANVPTPRGGSWGPSNVRNILNRVEAK
ncbi:recombinase family protein [uncultured Reyranella sp.]|uniref:recombinase family protein n=1 Tax=uncultured Reyranella sp. TaxID=735512 RepID=UPI0025E1C229|nr:recombinase family protein [uncultured Reyranella sp.]